MAGGPGCQYKVTGWLPWHGTCTSLPWFESGPVTTDLTTTVEHIVINH